MNMSVPDAPNDNTRHCHSGAAREHSRRSPWQAQTMCDPVTLHAALAAAAIRSALVRAEVAGPRLREDSI